MSASTASSNDWPAEPELARQRAYGLLGCDAVELDSAGERRVRRKAAEQEVRVGDGGQLAAAPVAGWAGVGAGRHRADAQRAARVAPGDRAAAGADRVDVERGQRQRAARDRASGR